MKQERGAGRIALGLTLLIGVAGSADQAPLTLGMLPMAALSLLIGLWGVQRSQHGPTLARLSMRASMKRTLAPVRR